MTRRDGPLIRKARLARAVHAVFSEMEALGWLTEHIDHEVRAALALRLMVAIERAGLRLSLAPERREEEGR